MDGDQIPKEIKKIFADGEADSLKLSGVKLAAYKAFMTHRIHQFLKDPEAIFKDSEKKLYYKTEYSEAMLATLTKVYDQILGREETGDTAALNKIQEILDLNAEQTNRLAKLSKHYGANKRG